MSKQEDLARDTVDLSGESQGKLPMTTDYGIKIADPDHWLRVADAKRTGPSLLEDPIAREKVGLSLKTVVCLCRKDFC